MIIDLNKFISEGQPFWKELDQVLGKLKNNSDYKMDLEEIQRFHYLYQKAASDLSRLKGLTSDNEIKKYLEAVVLNAFTEIHGAGRKRINFNPFKFFLINFPKTFRKQIAMFWLAMVIMLSGAFFGGASIVFDTDAKTALMPFSHLQLSPGERVAKEEKDKGRHLKDKKTSFSSQLMTHNTQVSILVMSLGITFGLGTILVLFTNGMILGAVVGDYVAAGQVKFVAGWLLPHGVIEIPAVLLAGQAGLIIALAMTGRGKGSTMVQRLKSVSKDVVTIVYGVAILLVWAGIIEAFMSQYHEPVLPYEIKIIFGFTELVLLIFFLKRSGLKDDYV